MGRKCVIKGCDSKTSNPEHRGVTYHTYPLDAKVRQSWVATTQLEPEKNITKSVLVCSRHFRRSDFHAAKEGKYLLKAGTIPSIFPWGKISSDGSGANTPEEEPSQASVEAKIEQIMAETAELEKVAATSGDSPSSAANVTLKTPAKTSRQSASAKNAFSTSPINFAAGVQVEAQDFDGNWYPAKVQEVDTADNEVLIKFEKNASKDKVDLGEWLPMNSSRLRHMQKSATKTPTVFVENEKVLAKWTGSGKYPATVKEVLENNTYEVLFDDGFAKRVRGYNMTKIRTPAQKAIASSSIVATPSPKAAAPVSKYASTILDWPLISMSSLNMDELNLPEIPQDGEWCCYWVNDQPIGKEGFLQVGDHKKPTVIVEDWRLPADWVKHMYQRSNVLGKWDVILVNPQNKRFRSKSDLKIYLEELGDVYNPDIYDFSIHRRRAKDIGAYTYTKDFKANTARSPQTPQTPAANISNLTEVLATTPFTETLVATELPPAELMTVSSPMDTSALNEVLSEPISPLEEGYVFVGSLKVQLVDNLFKCPQEGCNKTFRKENHLQIHVKHYHADLVKKLGTCPNMQDLAAKRTGTPIIEPLPKNQIPNQQFFAKLHEQDMQHVKHRKSIASTSATTVPDQTLETSLPVHITGSPLNEAPSENKAAVANETIESSVSSTINKSLLDETVLFDELVKPLETAEMPVTPLTTASHKKGDRKSNRQRTTKKYLTASTSTPKPFDESLNISETEDRATLANSLPPPAKKPKMSQQSTPIVSADNSQTAGSVADTTEIPEYINENGEIIKIVRMRQEEIINCLCSYPEEDGLMIQCELCLCWQHGVCNGIEKESQVPDKYVCYICKNPQRGRDSMKYIHDQDWLYYGKLPVGNYHASNPELNERFDLLKRSHTLTGNLIEMKRFLHSLLVKINISENKDHPKMYLWAKEWEKTIKSEDDKADVEMKDVTDESTDNKDNIKVETPQIDNITANIILPEEPINPADCRKRLLQHIKTQQSHVMARLQDIEADVLELESLDNLLDLKSADFGQTKNTLSLLIKDLERMKTLAKINTIANDQQFLQTI